MPKTLSISRQYRKNFLKQALASRPFPVGGADIGIAGCRIRCSSSFVRFVLDVVYSCMALYPQKNVFLFMCLICIDTFRKGFPRRLVLKLWINWLVRLRKSTRKMVSNRKRSKRMHKNFICTNMIFYCKKWDTIIRFYQDGLQLPVLFSNSWFVESGTFIRPF